MRNLKTILHKKLAIVTHDVKRYCHKFCLTLLIVINRVQFSDLFVVVFFVKKINIQCDGRGKCRF